jgi:hypothetical protein
LGLAVAGILWWLSESKIVVPRLIFTSLGTLFLLLLVAAIAIPLLSVMREKGWVQSMWPVILIGIMLGGLFGGISWWLSGTRYEVASVHESMAASQATPEKPSEPPKKQPAPPVVIPPNSVVSIDQKGGITAGTVNITTGIPEPKFDIRPIVENKPEGTTYRTEFMLSIETKVPITNLYLQVGADTIMKMEVVPQRSGGFITGHSGIRTGFAFTNIPNAYGSYKVTAVSKSPDKFKVTYSIDGQ